MRLTIWALSLLVGISSATAQGFSDPFDHWPLDLRINGAVIVGNEVEDLEDLAGTLGGSELSGRVTLLVERGTTREQLVQYASLFHRSDDYRVVRRDPDQGFAEVASLLPECQTFLWHSSAPLTEDDAKKLTRQKNSFDQFLSRGGTAVFMGPAGECVGQHFVSDDQEQNVSTPTGLGLFADCLFELADQPNSSETICECLKEHSACVGVTVAKGTLLRLTGRTCSASGLGSVTFVLSGGDRETQSQTIAKRTPRNRSANEFLIDLTQWRRRAIDRCLDPFPAAKPEPPHVARGTLVIVGGGGMPAGLMQRFVDLAGGKDNANLVYVPCSERAELSPDQSTVRLWKRMGVQNATFIHTKDRKQANEDDEFLAPLVDATGVWFGGGRQWNFADSYYGTRAQQLMKEVLARGGVVGGSSAGASVQAGFLARATPIENYRILAPGYQRGGLGFITGVAIDQHFSQRRRQKDMAGLVNRYPQLLGIGIDESTALIVNKSVGEVVGKGDVYFYDRSHTPPDDGPDYVKLARGSTYDLAKRKVLVDSRQPPESENDRE